MRVSAGETVGDVTRWGVWGAVAFGAACGVEAPTTPPDPQVARTQCAAIDPVNILVDASRDGGAWWFPQHGTFSPDADHQGRPLAEYLRSRGYVVDELGRGERIAGDRLEAYATVIRAGNFGEYTESELDAYGQFLACDVTVWLLGEFLRSGRSDELADMMGVVFAGQETGRIVTFGDHPLTAGVTEIPFIAGAIVRTDESKPVRVLGRLDDDAPVMGIAEHETARIFFLGDTNGLELVPQPLVGNLIDWSS